MAIIIFDDIIKINEFLKEYGIKASLQDACGMQSIKLKYLESNEKIDFNKIDKKIYVIIEKYFFNKNMKVEYGLDKAFLFIK